MLNIFISIIAILITILLVVGIHELGHFLVAKLSGIKVLRFSIGFGKALFKWYDKQGTEYVIAAIPLGGYVKMLDEGEGPVADNQLQMAFNRQPFYKKFAVIAAGPIFNLIFALIIYWFLFLVGFNSISPIIGKLTPNSIAANANLKPQEEIVAIDGKLTHNWTTVIINILTRTGDKNFLTITTKNPNTQKNLIHTLNLTDWKMDDLKPDPLASLGIEPYEPSIPAIIKSLQADSPAALAGIKPGDKILAIQNHKVEDFFDVVTVISERPKQTLPFTIERQKQTLVIPITIGAKRNWSGETGFLGITPEFELPKNLLKYNKYDAFTAIQYAARDVKAFTQLNFIILGKMLTGKISLKSLGGPITIFESAGIALNNGFVAFFSFLAFLSISIGIINLIPVPGLDGGHLLFQVIEWVRQKPVAEKTQMLFFRLGLIFLLLIMTQALVNDILRL